MTECGTCRNPTAGKQSKRLHRHKTGSSRSLRETLKLTNSESRQQRWETPMLTKNGLHLCRVVCTVSIRFRKFLTVVEVRISERFHLDSLAHDRVRIQSRFDRPKNQNSIHRTRTEKIIRLLEYFQQTEEKVIQTSLSPKSPGTVPLFEHPESCLQSSSVGRSSLRLPPQTSSDSSPLSKSTRFLTQADWNRQRPC